MLIKKTITLIRPIGTKRKPAKNSGDKISIMWNCLGCDESSEFTARLSYEGKKKGIKSQSQKTSKNSVKFSVDEPGLYKVTLSCSGFGSKTGYITVDMNQPTKEGGGCSSFPTILFLLLIAVAGYFLWKRSQNVQPVNENFEEKKRKRKPAPGKKKDNDLGIGSDDSSSGGDYW